MPVPNQHVSVVQMHNYKYKNCKKHKTQYQTFCTHKTSLQIPKTNAAKGDFATKYLKLKIEERKTYINMYTDIWSLLLFFWIYL